MTLSIIHGMDKYLQVNDIYCGRSEELMKHIAPASVSLSFWSPPYFVGKEYEIDETYDSWQEMLRQIIILHSIVLKPGGFMVINIADILAFKDAAMPRIQGMNIANHKSQVTREMVLDAKSKFPGYSRDQLAAYLGCSEQTVDRRLNGNNIRGGKHQIQTRVKLVGGSLEKFAYDCGIYLYDKRIWKKDPAWANSRWTTNTLKAVSETEEIYIFWKPGEYAVNRARLSEQEWKDWGYRQIWDIQSVRKNDDHEAKFPDELARRVIKLFSDTDDIVLDPFLGSGTTVIAAYSENRRFIGIEKEEKYVLLSRNNLKNTQDQLSLFDTAKKQIPYIANLQSAATSQN
ncbi:MAG: site-specific DNA-methyltransferase [Spirochaetota bacterium]|jgi:site-specific DNA-methyltransferase (adenine-specific)|nr:site-specific DNA-methyltransferase [Spirochaetota bacterium]